MLETLMFNATAVRLILPKYEYNLSAASLKGIGYIVNQTSSSK